MYFALSIAVIAAICYSVYRFKCRHDWQNIDHFHCKKTHTYVYLCEKCKRVRTETHSR